MKMFAQALDLRDEPGVIETYKQHHRRVWPEVTAALQDSGIASMHIFLTGTRLFMVMEAHDGFDPARDFQTFAQHPRCRQWDELMRTMQRRVPGAGGGEGEWWTPMEEVFDLGWFAGPDRR